MWMIAPLFQYILDVIFPKACYGCRYKGVSLCDQCLQKQQSSLQTPYPFIMSVYSFKSPLIRRCIHSIKYFHRKDLIGPFAKKMTETLRTHNISGTVIPIPMHPVRKMIRGYNQAEILGRLIAENLNFPYAPNLLSRLRFGNRQVQSKTRKERLKNQKGTFVASDDIAGLDIILVDDVTTTGATLLEARNILKLKGARSVTAITIAH